MRLALFDLDNTLIAGDSDHAWGEFLCANGYVDEAAYRAKNDEFYQQYEAGELDVHAYLEFSLQPLVGKDPDTLNQWHQQFMRDCIAPIMLPTASDLLEYHRERGDRLMVITSTQRFIVEPIVKALDVELLIATEAERDSAGRFTGKVSGTPSFREGKIERLKDWLLQGSLGQQFPLSDACFYSDSINDLPLMEEVGEAIAVDPDEALEAEARQRGWKIITLRA